MVGRCSQVWPGVFLSVIEQLIWRVLGEHCRSLSDLARVLQYHGREARRELRVVTNNLVDRGVLEREGRCYRRASTGGPHAA